METTFVNQLYKSIDLSGLHSHKNCPTGSKSSKHKLTSICASCGQFKVLRDGCWSKIDFRGDEPEVDEQEESNKVPLVNPWIQHYRNSKLQAIRKFPASSKAPLATTENQNPARNFQLWSQDSVGSNTEVTDQNFNDEPLEEENSRRIQTKTTTDIVSSNDQVVPFGNIVDVVEDHVDILPKD
ncbi:hypothetical protein DH2020_004081 [Rehmannia glutinosa]|uniref:Uncharacterized protein n=1 Tax=Rehmannia glutinosa TaxID=99300 RepID=A0ABR0XNN1_REHGL